MPKHITHTGPYAGETYCGAIRDPQDQNCHLPYMSRKNLIHFIHTKIDCPDCQKIALDVWEADDE